MVATIEPANQSGLREFIGLLASVRGDLSVISAPPFLLAPQSLVEFPSYWAEQPSLFVAPALESDPARRALLVLKLWLSAFKRQFYVGASGDVTKTGIKKPLNPFLGEFFLGEWDDGKARTKVVSEQVSHHPPTTACYVTSSANGIHAQAHSTQSTTLNFPAGIPTVFIKQSGHAILHIDAYNEDHLLPLPDVRVKGVLSGSLYPELAGTYRIVSSSGFTSEVCFSGKGWMSGSKNSFDASIFHTNDEIKGQRPASVYTARGQWSVCFDLCEGKTGKVIETCNPQTATPIPLSIPDVNDQDPWESRRAWAPVISALKQGDFMAVVREKGKIEDAQRAMRRMEKRNGEKWETEFFRRTEVDRQIEALGGLATGVNIERLVGSTGVWRFDFGKERERRRRGLRGRGGREGGTPLG